MPNENSSFHTYLVDSSAGETTEINIPDSFLVNLKQTIGIQAEKLSFVITAKVAGEDDQRYFVLYPDKDTVPELVPALPGDDTESHGFWKIVNGKVVWQPLPHL